MNAKVHFVTIKNQPQVEVVIEQFLEKLGAGTTELMFVSEEISKCLAMPIDETLRNYFIFETFSEDVHKFLRQYKNKVYVCSANCYFESIYKRLTIPFSVSHPIYSLCMHDVVVTCTKLKLKKEKEIQKLVRWMGGEYSKSLTKQTTHVVAGSVISKKCQKAYELQLLVMTEEWVKETWKMEIGKMQRKWCRSPERELLLRFRCPALYNLRITLSQISVKQRKNFKRLVEEHGGVYCADLVVGKTDVVLIEDGCGEKFKYATRWRIPCVKLRWLYDSLHAGHPRPFEPYLVAAAPPSSTPTYLAPLPSPREIPLLHNTEFSVIENDCSDNELRKVEETQASSDSFTFVRPKDPSPTTSVLKASTSNSCKTHSEVRDKKDAEEGQLTYQKVLDEITVNNAKKCGALFDGCKVYLSGFDNTEEEKLRRVLKFGGALRFTELNESITHVVVAAAPRSQDVQYLQQFSNKPHLVKLDWIAMSLKRGTLIPEHEYLFKEHGPDIEEKQEPSRSQSPPPSLVAIVSQPGTPKRKQHFPVQQPSPLSKKGLQILNSDLPSPKNKNPSDNDGDLVPPAEAARLIENYSQGHQSDEKAEISHPLQSSLHSCSTNVRFEDESSFSTFGHDLFFGVTFMIVGDHSSDTKEKLESAITEHGGCLLRGENGDEESEQKNAMAADYLVLPIVPIYNATQLSKFTQSNRIVTALWLEECIMKMKMVDVEYYHRPIEAPLPLSSYATILQDCVITFSSYDLQERLFLEKIAALLGANCQDVLSRKENPLKGVRRTTHLVCDASHGSKFEAANRWNLSIYGHAWLVGLLQHSQLSERSQPTCQYPVANSVTKSIASSSELLPNVANREKSSEVIKSIPSSKRSNSTVNVGTHELNLQITENVKDHDHENSGLHLSNPNQNIERSWPLGYLLQINEFNEKRSNGIVANEVNNFGDVASVNDIRNAHHARKRNICDVIQDDDQSSRNANDDEEYLSVNEHLNVMSEVDRNQTGRIKRRNDNRTLSEISKKNGTENDSMPWEEEMCQVGWQDTLSDYSQQADKKKKYERIAEELGSLVLPYYCIEGMEEKNVKQIKATHIVLDELKKTEKLLCAIASGIWVLHVEYLDQSSQQGSFLQESDFEWGNPANEEKYLSGSVKEWHQIARAAYRRRLMITNDEAELPFNNMKTVLICEPSDLDTQTSLRRVVESGGGTVLPASDILKCTHCLVKSSKLLSLIRVPLEQLAAKKIHCLPAVYLSDVLLFKSVNPQHSYFDSYKRTVKQLQDN